MIVPLGPLPWLILISPVSAAAEPLLYCTKVAAKRSTSPSAAYNACVTVKLPVSVLGLGPLPETRRPGTLLAWNGQRVALS